jgi:hypothetical protein
MPFAMVWGGCGVTCDLMWACCQEWNVSRLSSLLSRVLEENGANIPGVTSAYLYFGMWRAFFAWQCEDMDLYSVNYLHFGEGKFW